MYTYIIKFSTLSVILQVGIYCKEIIRDFFKI